MCIFATSVAQQDASQQNSPIADDPANESTVVYGAGAQCYWNGAVFKDGDKVCAEGTTYECSLGKWLQAQGVC